MLFNSKPIDGVALQGCSPTPLAHYLKALGIFRLLSEQMEGICAHWKGSVFVVSGEKLTAESITEFFLRRYRPTPIIAPWNGGSGFFSSDNQVAIGQITGSEEERFKPYRETIQSAQHCLARLGMDAKPEKDQKESLLRLCRGTLPESALDWLDAAFVLTSDGAKFPPLLGTGGNDGRLEFTNNFMQRLAELFGLDNGKAAKLSASHLNNALFGAHTDKLTSGAVGQFYPSASGGANAAAGFDGKSLVNPWDYVLMLEGALVFAGATVKRLNAGLSDQLAYPFSVRHSGVGFASSTTSDEETSATRGEIWMPLWERPVSFAELTTVFSEGRAEVKGKPARNGVDFTRAVVSLGVDRGLSGFQRYGFQVRNGLAYFAVPLDRVEVSRNPNVELLHELDQWLRPFLGKAKNSKSTPPSSIQRAARRIEVATVAFCKAAPNSWRETQDLLIAVGQGERALNRSRKWTSGAFLKPLVKLSPRWLDAAYNNSATFRLAASLASLTSRLGKKWLPLRHHLEPIKSGAKDGEKWCAWEENSNKLIVSTEGPLEQVLNAILSRRLIIESQVDPSSVKHLSALPAQPADITAFIEGGIDDRLFVDLLWGLSLIDFGEVDLATRKRFLTEDTSSPPALYALLKLCFSGQAAISDCHIPITPMIHRRAASGAGLESSQLAARRLRASGLRIGVREIAMEGRAVHRIAAALLFPLGQRETNRLLEQVARPDKDLTKNANHLLHNDDESQSTL